MKKSLMRLGKKRFMILCFVLLLVGCYWHNGWLGLIAGAFGWFLGMVIYNRKEYKPRFIRFLKRRTAFQIKGAILLPIFIWACWYAGWLGAIGSVIGWVIGEWICRRVLKLNG